MRKFLLPLLLLVSLLLWSGNLVSANAQQTPQQAREAEWNSYALPKANFTRKTDPDRNIVFRVPADWQQQSESLIFKGPNSATLQVVIQKVPEGYPLDEYFAATLKIVKDRTSGENSLVTRRTQFQDVEAREMVLDWPNPEGELIRRMVWITINGAHAVAFNLIVPAAHAAEIEPYFKAVVQSVIFVSPSAEFEETRAAMSKSATASPIDEIENIAEQLSETTAQRDAAIARLSAIFGTQPEAALDLLLDRRPLVRVAAVRAAAQSKNDLLTPILWELLDDHEPLVSEAAARRVANTPDVVSRTLERSMSGFQTEKIARVWPYLTKEKRNELLGIILKEVPVSHGRTLKDTPPVRRGVTVRVGELAPVKPGTPPPPVTIASVALTDPNVQLGALTLLSTIPPDEFKMPFERIVASSNEPLIAVALQVASLRGEALPVASLLKLVSSSNEQVSRFAADSLAMSATLADVSRIEALIAKDSSRRELNDRLKLVIKKINFRGTLAAARSEDEKRALIKNALSDSELAEFAWRQDCEATVAGCAAANAAVTANTNFTIKPLGENVFPQQLKHYSAILNPRQTVQRLYESLHGLQLDSPRSQASLVLLLMSTRKFMAQSLSAPIDAEELIDYSGIDPDAPIALGAWTAPNARDSIAPAERKAIVLRVKDRARFERNVDTVQRLADGFMHLTEGVGATSRAVAAVPALIPLIAQTLLTTEPTTAPKKFPVLHYSFIGEQEWNGFKLRVLENRSVENDWTITNDVTYIAYLGDTAILAPDLASLREALTNAAAVSDRKLLAENSDFRQAIDGGGDVVYFSDLNAVFAEPGDKNQTAKAKVRERGALKFSGSVWETSHHFVFAESDWAKPLLPFHPQELTAARELLPASTIGYFSTKVDLPALWLSSAKNLAPELALLPALWTLDFQKEVLPELGPECGLALTRLPDVTSFTGETWAAFCKLKSNKLGDALIAGKLLRGVGPTTDVAEIKIGGNSYFIAARRGFLVVANSAKVLASFDGKTSLASTRDYSRSVEKVPNGIVAFAGYNLEAAIAAASNGAVEGLRGQLANVLVSLAGAFHSQNFYATATAGSMEAHSSVSMDREGRYAVADFSALPRSTSITYAVIEPHGVPITDQRRLSRLVLRLRAKAAGPIENIKDDLKSKDQTVEQKSATELLVTIAARQTGAEKAIQLPVADPEFAPYLKATTEFASDKKEVIDQARQIAGNDRDAWSVARKLSAWVNKNLEWKLTISANPVQTLATREADCSEFSALFIAMARSLGLPARPVSGLAFNGNSFGGHAWVEVWAGRWIELDPTWGTSFVDATHIRNATNSLVTSAALNLIELEVVETKRAVAEFQKSPQALAEHLGRVIPLGDKSEIEAAIDVSVLVDEHMGAGAWARLSDSEREQVWSAYARFVTEVLTYAKREFGTPQLRLMHLADNGDSAEAIYVKRPGDLLLKLRFVRRDDVWHLVEVFQTDTSLNIAAEMFQPAIARINKTRAGEKPSLVALSNLVRVLFLVDKEPAKASHLADEFLQTKPKDTGLRFLKAIALLNEQKTEIGVKLLTELGDEGFAPALYRLAGYFANADDPVALKKAIALYQRYTSLEPHDPRGWRELAGANEHAEQFADAAAAYRKAIDVDAAELDYYHELIRLIVTNNLDGDVRALLVAGEKHQAADEDLYGSIMQDFVFTRDAKTAEKFALAEPLRMKTSALANVSFGELLIDAKRYVEAERLLNTALQLDKKSAAAKKSNESDEDAPESNASSADFGDLIASDAYIGLARLYRKQSRWLAAVKAADAALAVREKNVEAHYQRACALARLGRANEAMAALTRAIELNPSTVDRLAGEPDLQPLYTLPALKKLLPTNKEKP